MLAGCTHQSRTTPHAAASSGEETRSLGVLSELGIAHAEPMSDATPAPHRRGPCLIAGDRLAWRWAVAFEMIPLGYDAPVMTTAEGR